MGWNHQPDYIWSNYSDLTRPHPKWWFSKGNPVISGKPRLVKYDNLARLYYLQVFLAAELPFPSQEATQIRAMTAVIESEYEKQIKAGERRCPLKMGG